MFWSRKEKFYFANRAEWTAYKKEKKANSSASNKINYPVLLEKSFKSKSFYFPVTLPRTYRRSFTLLKIVNDEIWVYKNVSLRIISII